MVATEVLMMQQTCEGSTIQQSVQIPSDLVFYFKAHRLRFLGAFKIQRLSKVETFLKKRSRFL